MLLTARLRYRRRGRGRIAAPTRSVARRTAASTTRSTSRRTGAESCSTARSTADRMTGSAVRTTASPIDCRTVPASTFRTWSFIERIPLPLPRLPIPMATRLPETGGPSFHRNHLRPLPSLHSCRRRCSASNGFGASSCGVDWVFCRRGRKARRQQWTSREREDSCRPGISVSSRDWLRRAVGAPAGCRQPAGSPSTGRHRRRSPTRGRQPCRQFAVPSRGCVGSQDWRPWQVTPVVEAPSRPGQDGRTRLDCSTPTTSANSGARPSETTRAIYPGVTLIVGDGNAPSGRPRRVMARWGGCPL